MRARTPAIPLVLLLGAAIAFPQAVGDPTVMTIAVWTLVYVGGACAWNLFSGFSGYFSFGHAAFYGIGAYTVALLGSRWHVAGGYPSFLLLPLGGLVAGAISLPIGWIALRSRHMVFAMVTIAIFFIFQLLAFNLQGLTHGSLGVEAPMPPWTGNAYNIPFYYLALAVAAIAFLAGWLVRRSPFGLGLLAIRDDEDRARGLGLRAARTKRAAFALSAVLAGMVGGVFALFSGSIYPQFAFDANYDVTIIGCVLLGGLGTVYGPLLGACVVIPLQQWFSLHYGASGWYSIFYGLMFLAVILYLPDGIVSTAARRLRQRRERRAAPKLAPVVNPVEEALR